MSTTLKKCQNPCCNSGYFFPTTNRQMYCTPACRQTAYRVTQGLFLDQNLLPQTCALHGCDAPINRGTVRKVARFCCDAHRQAFKRNPTGRKRKNKLGICLYEECSAEFIKHRSDQKFCCAEHKTKHNNGLKMNKQFLLESRTLHRLVCDWSGEYFESYNEKQRFATSNYKTAFHNSGFSTASVTKSERFTEHSFDNQSFEDKVFSDCIFDYCTFNHTILNHVRFVNCEFSDCDFYFTSLSNVNFVNNSWLGENTFEQDMVRSVKFDPPIAGHKNVSFTNPTRVGKGKTSFLP